MFAPLESPRRAARSRRKPIRAGSLGGISAPRDDWLGVSPDENALERMGIKPRGGGPHQSKTMMLAELTTLLASGGTDEPRDAIVRDNLLGKPSIRAREAALYRLRQLYGVGAGSPIGALLHRLWYRDPTGPMLALLCALARDPPLRDGAAAVLDARVGERVRWPAIAAAFEARYAGRLGEQTAKSLAQHAASSWTQAGFLEGTLRKERVRANPTPTAASVLIEKFRSN
jgi:hypothetical protein